MKKMHARTIEIKLILGNQLFFRNSLSFNLEAESNMFLSKI